MAQKKRIAPRLNPHRGEAVWNGRKLCLTMNALVEIEEGLGVPLSKMGVALANPTMKQLRLILGALVRGGGGVVQELDPESKALGMDVVMTTRPITDEEIGSEMLDLAEATKAIEQAFMVAGVFTPAKDGEAPAPGN